MKKQEFQVSRKRAVSGVAITLGAALLVVAGLATTLIAFSTTKLSQYVSYYTEGREAREKKAAEDSQADLVPSEPTPEQLIRQRQREREIVEAKEKNSRLKTDLAQKEQLSEKRSVQVAKSEARENAAIFSFEDTKDSFSAEYYRRHLVKNRDVLESAEKVRTGIAGIKANLNDIIKILTDIDTVKLQLKAEEEVFKAKEAEFNQALSQRLSIAKELALYFLTFKFIWGVFTGYARTHYPYLQEQLLKDAQVEFNTKTRLLKGRLTSLKQELDYKIVELFKVATLVSNSVVATQLPRFAEYFNIHLLNPVRLFVDKVDALKQTLVNLDEFSKRLLTHRKENAGHNPQYTPNAYVKTVGQALFNLEAKQLESEQDNLKQRLDFALNEQLKLLIRDLTIFLSKFEVESLNQGEFFKISQEDSRKVAKEALLLQDEESTDNTDKQKKG